MSEHTRGPWSAFPDPKARCWRIDGPGGSYKHVADAIDEIHARRIVACVNACAGMADPAAEIEKLKARCERLTEAASEMVLALEWHPEPSPFGLEINREFAMRSRIDIARNKLRAAIAEIDGGE